MPFGSSLLGFFRFRSTDPVTLALMPVQILILLMLPRFWWALPLIYHSYAAASWVLQRPCRSERRPRHGPTCSSATMCTYFDIPVLGSILPVSFVAKTEVAEWPGYGLLAKLQRTVFVDRRRNTTMQQRDLIHARLAAGDQLVLFPEGTSNDGNRILPFRSALLSVAEAA